MLNADPTSPQALSVLVLTLGALVLLAGCSGKTTGATNITPHLGHAPRDRSLRCRPDLHLVLGVLARERAAVLRLLPAEQEDAGAGPRPRGEPRCPVVDRDHRPGAEHDLSLGVLRVTEQRRQLRLRRPPWRGRLDHG